MHPSVDVIIPTYRPGPELRGLLQRLLRQNVVPEHIFLVNTQEAAFDSALIENLPRVSICHIPKKAFDHGGTRQMALGLSKAAYVLFMTQDALPADKCLIERLLSAVAEPGVRVAYARQLPRGDCCVIERYTRLFNYPETSRVKNIGDLPELGIKTFFCSNVAALYDRAYLLAGGGFYVPSIFNEDMVFAVSPEFRQRRLPGETPRGVRGRRVRRGGQKTCRLDSEAFASDRPSAAGPEALPAQRGEAFGLLPRPALPPAAKISRPCLHRQPRFLGQRPRGGGA